MRKPCRGGASHSPRRARLRRGPYQQRNRGRNGLYGGHAQRVVLFFQVTRQQGGSDDREHQARVRRVELLGLGGQHDAAQDRTVDILGLRQMRGNMRRKNRMNRKMPTRP